jgi:acetyl-CoA acetyltransferase
VTRYAAEIPYGAYWSTPFARWQGSFAHLHSIEFAAYVTKRELARRNIDPAMFDHGVLGLTVPQPHAFYGLPWLAGMSGAPRIAGQTVMQACATGARALLAGVQEVETGLATMSLVITCDRTSNGPHLYYPNPQGPGGTGSHEDWVLENFRCDPLGSHAMVRTAENVAARHRVSTAEQHDVVLRREAQYGAAKADNSAFLRRFVTLPFDVPAHDFRKTIKYLDGDEGIRASTPDALARLRPVIDGGTVTYGAQTHPADGNAGIVVTTRERAREVASDPKRSVRILGFGSARAELGFMPEAALPAARQALAVAGLGIRDLHAIKTHNPFAVNDVLFAREMDVDLDAVNNFGSSLVWGHPQAPMGTRSIIELIEELALRGGGDGLFTGCAAGDTAMAVVLRVGDA